MFFVIVLVFCLVFSDISFAAEIHNNNYQHTEHTITYHVHVDTTITSNMASSGLWHDSNINLSDFATKLFAQMGTTDILDGYYYMYRFDFPEFDFSIYDTTGKLYYHQDGANNYRLKGSAWVNNNTTHSISIPFSSNKSPFVFHASTWDIFKTAVLHSRYTLAPNFKTKEIGYRVVVDYKYSIRFGVDYRTTLGDVIDAIHQDNSDVTSAIDRQTEQQKQYHDRDESDATKAKKQIIGVTDKFDEVQNKWAILWYPITFTNKVLGAFTGQHARDGNDNYIVGYNYNDDTGGLEPIYDFTRAKRAGSASITFPSFTLPILNLKLWNSYTYDLSQLSKQFPVLFNALYVIVGVLELYWFVGFLSDKYHQIFGG